MKIIEDPKKESELIKKIIKNCGHTPDHNFDWLMYCSDEGSPKTAMWENKYAMWFYLNSGKNEATIVSDPIAPTNFHYNLEEDLATYLFKTGNRKIFFLDVRENVNNFCKNKKTWKYDFYYELIWPIMDMEKFDLKLPGKNFKSIRNAKNKFYKENKVEVVKAESVDKHLLHDMVNRWHKQRLSSGIPELYPNRYHNMINADFMGTDSSRVMIVNGKVAGLNAGWKTPGKEREWSASIGLHDFSTKDLGIALILEDLEWIKNKGYKTCDLEGSEEESLGLKFKAQFKPSTSYKTYTFWISQET